jgi:diguanylate cyclase (GGDEF)-like protein
VAGGAPSADHRRVEAIEIPVPHGWDDPFTGTGGPDLWRRLLVGEVARSVRYGRPLTVVAIELHGTEELAERLGLDAARHVLRRTAQTLVRASRGSDTCARIGPSRFGVVLVETDEVMAVNFVERVRESLPRALPGALEGLRLGFGWASPRGLESADALVTRASTRLMVELLGDPG